MCSSVARIEPAVPSTVASSGASLSPAQASAMRRLAQRLWRYSSTSSSDIVSPSSTRPAPERPPGTGVLYTLRGGPSSSPPAAELAQDRGGGPDAAEEAL